MIKVEFIGLDKFRRKLKKFSKSQDRIMKRALNRARVAGQTMAVREIKGLSGYKVQYIRGQIKSFSGKNSATIIINEKRARNLVDGVVPSQQNYEYGRAKTKSGRFKREGVKSKGWSERKRKVYHGSFIAAPTGNALVFKRDRNGGLHPVYGASINNIIHKDKKLQERINQRMFEVFDRTYIHEFDRIMNK
ncbi:phage tail protein [Vibrio parahaemolyticus]|nr:phage tail protein [Vibrio parahaemolyticus]